MNTIYPPAVLDDYNDDDCNQAFRYDIAFDGLFAQNSGIETWSDACPEDYRDDVARNWRIVLDAFWG